jgi:hypothetical protein
MESEEKTQNGIFFNIFTGICMQFFPLNSQIPFLVCQTDSSVLTVSMMREGKKDTNDRKFESLF